MEPVTVLKGLGATVAWVEAMEPAVLWVRPYRIMLLNSACDPDELSDAVTDIMPEVFRTLAGNASAGR